LVIKKKSRKIVVMKTSLTLFSDAKINAKLKPKRVTKFIYSKMILLNFSKNKSDIISDNL